MKTLAFLLALSVFLSPCLSGKEKRIVGICVVSHSDSPADVRDVRNWLDRTSWRYHDVGIRFVVAEYATYKGSLDPNEIMSKGLPCKDAEIPIIFSNTILPQDKNVSEQDQVFGGAIPHHIIVVTKCVKQYGYRAVKTRDNEEQIILTLVHEIGHFLGLPHSDAPYSFMYRRPVFVSLGWDRNTVGVLRNGFH